MLLLIASDQQDHISHEDKASLKENLDIIIQ